MPRHVLIASHAHFAAGIKESIDLLAGERGDVRSLCMFVDGRDDVAEEARRAVSEMPRGGDLVICTDLFGGSVNNEFAKIVQERPDTYLVANMNLPLLIQLLFADESAPTDRVLREICAAEETRVAYVNDLLAENREEEEF